MGKFLKNNMLLVGGAAGALGLVLTLLSFVFFFGNEPSWLAWYGGTVQLEGGTDLNLWIMIVGPLVLLTGTWYFGEQLILRNKFERLLDTPKKSEFMHNKKELEELARELPDEFHARIEKKESEFTSKRAA